MENTGQNNRHILHKIRLTVIKFAICFLIRLPANSYLSLHLITTYHKGSDFARIGTLMQIKKRMVAHPLFCVD